MEIVSLREDIYMRSWDGVKRNRSVVIGICVLKEERFLGGPQQEKQRGFGNKEFFREWACPAFGRNGKG